ncbi:MAG: beta-ketoacyl synthase, partial [Acidimicrobiales bacterium]
MQGRRVAVTGIGVVARAGIGAEAFWDGLLGEAPVGWRQIVDWDPSPYFDNPKDARRSDPCTQYALAAAAQALQMAGGLT